MPSDRYLRVINAVHRVAIRLGRGRFGWDASGMPVLELTTTGRRSGEKRSTLLTSPLQVEGTYVVVASRGGDDTHPAWFLNLRDDPNVEVVFKGGPRRPMVAHVATPEERARLWPQVTKKYRHYAGYQERTEREIPLVLLAPA